MSGKAPEQTLDIDQLAADNPAIDAARLKDWRQTMRRVERIERLQKRLEELGLNPDKPRDPPPRRMQQPILVGGRRVGFGNIRG